MQSSPEIADMRNHCADQSDMRGTPEKDEVANDCSLWGQPLAI